MCPLQNCGDSLKEKIVRQAEQRVDQAYEEFCKLSTAIKKRRDVYLKTINETPVTKTDSTHIENEQDLIAMKAEIEVFKWEIQELQAEIEVARTDNRYMNQRQVALICKLITGLALLESEGKYIGENLKDPHDLSVYDAKDPQLTTKLFNKLENL